MVAYVIRRIFSGLIMLLMVTLVTFVLFFAAAGLSMLFDRRRAKRDAAAGLAPADAPTQAPKAGA